MTRLTSLIALAAIITLPACADSNAVEPTEAPFEVTDVAQFDAPWALTFLPDGRLLVTEKGGDLHLFDPQSASIGTITGTPEVVHRGQGGFGDVVLHPDYEDNQLVYLSWVEAGEGGTGSVVGRAKLALDEQGGGQLEHLEILWKQSPKLDGDGHFGQRIAFGPDGMLWISSSERQHFDPAQDMSGNLGKIVRLHDDGRVPTDNPFQDQGDIAKQVWSLGHRNVLGIAFNDEGELWAHEMGPRGGDELNRIVRGANYGYPIVSNGNHYSGKTIPDHDTRPEFKAPVITWTPVISPSSLIFYDGDAFPDWQGDALIGGLSGQALVRVEFDGDQAREAARYDMKRRIRGVAQGPDGTLWLIEDGGRGGNGHLMHLTPKEG